MLNMFFKLLSFERPKNSTLKLYKCPTVPSPSVVFKNDLKTLPQSLFMIFDTPDIRNLFSKVYFWRDDLCQILDNSLNNFMPKGKLGLIVRAKPNSENLASLFPQSLSWAEPCSRTYFRFLNTMMHQRKWK
jgi:hypothetical protein